MTERAQTLAAAIREIVNEFQYYQCCEEKDVEDMLVAIRETCENWRTLPEPAQDLTNPPVDAL